MTPRMPGAESAAWEELRSLAARPFVILDTETTGLTAPEVVSIAIVDDRGRPLLHEIVQPARPIEPEAARINGFRAEDLAQRPAFPAIAPAVAEAVRGKRVVIYNAAYDMTVLANTHRRYGIAVPEFEPWCAMQWFARIYGQWDAGRAAYAWQSLAKAAEFFHVQARGAHDALADCLTTWAILREAFLRSGVRVLGMDALL